MGGVFTASIFRLPQNLILILTALSIGIIGVSSYNKTFSRAGILTGVLLLVFTIGIIRFNYVSFSKSILSQFSDIEAGGPLRQGSNEARRGIAIVLRGYVDDEPVYKNGKAQFIFKAKQLIAGDRIFEIDPERDREGSQRAPISYGVDERSLISANAFPKYEYGDFLAINGALKIPQNFDPVRSKTPLSEGSSADHALEAGRTSNGIDYVNYLKKEGIATTVSFPKIKTGEILELDFFEKIKIGFYKKIFVVKNEFELAVSRSVSEPNASFINGILLGSRQEIPDKLKEAFNKTGTSHILAVSGYNITIIADAVLLGLVYFVKRRRAFWISATLIVLFSVMTGASASVVRAAIMGILLSFASGYGRLSDARNSVVLAGAAMVFLNPMILVFDIGFQLSFAAVLGLIYVYPLLNSKTEKIPKVMGLKETVLMTLSAQFFVFPLLIYYFKNLSLVSVFANLLVLPFIPAAMFLGFLSGLAGIIFIPLGQITGFTAWAVTAYQIKIIEFFSSLPFASVEISINWIWLVVIYVLLILAAVSFSRKKID